MKPLQSALCLFASVLLTPAPMCASLLTWDFKGLTLEGATVVLPEAPGLPSNPIVFATGAKIEDDPTAPAARAVTLSGQQSEGGLSKRSLEPCPAIEINIRFKPSAGGAEQQTLIAASAAYELRYYPGREQLDFIVFYPGKKYTIVKVPAKAGVWHHATAKYQDGHLSLAVGQTLKEGALPAGVAIDPKPSRLRIGSQSNRPYSGSLGELSIRVP